eukprot:522954_1
MSSLVATSALLFLSSLCYCALTKSITIRNAGFETDGPLPMRTYQYGGTIITDWTEYDPEGLIDGSVGIANALGSTIFCIIGVINVRKIRLSMVIANDSEDEQEGREKQQCIGCWCWKYNEELFALDGLLYCEKCREHYDNGSSMMEEH